MIAHQAFYPITTMCRVLEVSTSGYYAWLKRLPSERERTDAELLVQIRRFHERSDGTYGVPRIYEDLTEEDVRVGPIGVHWRMVNGYLTEIQVNYVGLRTPPTDVLRVGIVCTGSDP